MTTNNLNVDLTLHEALQLKMIVGNASGMSTTYRALKSIIENNTSIKNHKFVCDFICNGQIHCDAMNRYAKNLIHENRLTITIEGTTYYKDAVLTALSQLEEAP